MITNCKITSPSHKLPLPKPSKQSDQTVERRTQPKFTKHHQNLELPSAAFTTITTSINPQIKPNVSQPKDANTQTPNNPKTPKGPKQKPTGCPQQMLPNKHKASA